MVKLTLQQKLQRYSKLYKCLEVCGNKLLQEISNNLILKTLIVSQKSKFFILFNIFFDNYGKIYAVILVKNLILLYQRILRFIQVIFDNTVYSLFNYLVTVMAIFVTIYNYRAHDYFITIVMKFRNYFPSSINYKREPEPQPGFGLVGGKLGQYEFINKNFSVEF